MAVAGVVATQLTDHSSRTFALFVDSNDVLKRPAMAGNAYGVPLETIRVTEAGPGGVSVMSFTIEDPTGALVVPGYGAEVRFHAVAHDHPEFLGYLQTVTLRPHELPGGRYMDVVATGIEALLDWTVIPAAAGAGGAPYNGRNWQVLASTVDVRALSVDASEAPTNGYQAKPIGDVGQGFVGSGSATLTTLRQAIQTVFSGFGFTGFATTISVTIDFYRGLRIWDPRLNGNPNQVPDDDARLTVVDTTAGALQAANLDYTLAPGDVVRAVYVNGSSPWGWFTDGSGITGPQAVISDASITTAAQAAIVANQYLVERAGAVRGSFDLETFDHGTTNYHAGSLVRITDAGVGLAATDFVIMAIEKTYYGDGREDWHVSFGGLAPSVVNAIRRLTRAQLN